MAEQSDVDGDARRRLLSYAMLGASVTAQAREGVVAAVVETVMCAKGWVCNPADHEGIPQPGECINCDGERHRTGYRVAETLAEAGLLADLTSRPGFDSPEEGS